MQVLSSSSPFKCERRDKKARAMETKRTHGPHTRLLFSQPRPPTVCSNAMPASARCLTLLPFNSNPSSSLPLNQSFSFAMKTPRRSPLPLHSDAASGCLSGALRRLLCAGAPGPDGCDSELGSAADGPHMQQQQQKSHHKPPSAPCIVARLMGLDSMPVFPYTPPPESLPRSRSTNSAESWPGLLSAGEDAAQARRTSASFREAPTYLRQENEDFFVLSFAPEDADGGELKERNNRVLKKEKKSSQKENLTERKQSGSKATVVAPPKEEVRRKSSRIGKLEDKVKPPPKQKQSPAKKPETARKKITASQRKNEAGCSSSQDTSPVSVLDYSISSKPSLSPPSEEERTEQRSRRKLSSKFENLSSNSSSPLPDRVCRDRATSLLGEPSFKKASNGNQVSRDWSQIWGKICVLTEQEVKSSTWTAREIWRSEEVSEIAAAVALDMLDLVLHEAVSEISSCAMNSKL